MHLYILKSLSEIMMDPDVHLFDHLIAGVPTGFQQDIPISNCFPILTDPIDNSHIHLSVHQTNWKSAEDNLDIARELVQAEVDAGWVEKFQGNLGDAQVKWPLGVSIGKLGIALSEHRPPRLVVDSSICGLNSRCAIPEKGTLPSIKDVQRCFPLRQNTKKLSRLSLDVKSAHKRIVVRSSEQGLLGFTLDNTLYFYRVCPFGAVFSASWWGRLSGFLMRLFHRVIYISHAGMIYVDDMFFMQDANIMPLTASLLSLFCQAIQIPLSWKKCELSSEVKWIGWYINVATGIISLSSFTPSKSPACHCGRSRLIPLFYPSHHSVSLSSLPLSLFSCRPARAGRHGRSKVILLTLCHVESTSDSVGHAQALQDEATSTGESGCASFSR